MEPAELTIQDESTGTVAMNGSKGRPYPVVRMVLHKSHFWPVTRDREMRATSEGGAELEGFTSLGAGLEKFRAQFAKADAEIDGGDSGAKPEKMVIGIRVPSHP